MINEEISKEAGQAAQTIISYTIKATKESINLEKEIRKKMNETLEKANGNLNPNHSYLSQLDVTYKTPDLMSHFLPP
ncbi:hypothetical protein RKU35_07325, partial [Streptococcus pneumoniae]|nr:hypothetical protein [Streptococcus pneumoniae]